MARILLSPLTRGLVVESPHSSLESHLAPWGMTTARVDEVLDSATLIDAIRREEAHVLFKRSRVPVTAEVLAACPSLHAVQLCCIGDDSVDKEAAAQHGVLVFNDPVSNARSVVELAVGHAIALARRLYETDVSAHANRWEKTNRGRFEIAGKRVGIVGLGNIGRQVARALEALGCEIAFHDTRPVAVEVGQEMGWTPVADLATLMATSDLVTVHTSARDAWGRDNEGMLNEVLHLLGSEREDSPRLFLNLARGNLHTPDALRAAIADRAIRFAAVDVYPDEPRPGESWTNPYADEPRVVCTPHIGAATNEAQPRIAARVARTIGGYSRLGRMRDCVFSPRATLQSPAVSAGQAVLSVVHSTSRGTKKAVADAIYECEASTLASAQQDFPNGIAYDLSILDRPLPASAIEALVGRAAELAGDPTAIRSVRQVVVESDG